MSQAPQEPRARVVVTGPRTGRPRRTSAAAEIDRQTGVGEVYIRSLMRAQLRLAMVVVATLAATIGALPLAFRVWPGFRDAQVAGVPLPWLLLGVLVYPLLLLIATLYVRQAERNERDFHDLVSR